MGTVHTVAVHFRYDRCMRRLANEFLGRNPIKVLRQEKGYGAKNSSQNFPASQIWVKLQEHVYRSRIHDVDQLKSHLIEE